MGSLLICISGVHQNVCHLLPGNGFSHPRCKCVIWDSVSCYFSCPLCLEGGLRIWFSLGKWYKVWLLKWSVKRVLFYVCSYYAGCSQVFLYLKQRSNFEYENLRITKSDGLEDTSSTVGLWISFYFISKGSLYPVFEDFEKKRHLIKSVIFFFNIVFSAFSIKRACFSFYFGIGFAKWLKSPVTCQQEEYWDILVNQYSCF